MKEQALCDAVLIALRQIARAIDLHSKQLVQRYGLTGPQALILKNLLGTQALSAGELAKRVNLSQATVTDILGRLERRRLVERQRSTTDKRRVLVVATKNAEKLLGTALPLLQESFVIEFKKLADWEQTLVLSTLQRVALMMNKRTEATDVDALPVLSTDSLHPPLEDPKETRMPKAASMDS